MRKLVYSALAFSAALAVGFGVQTNNVNAKGNPTPAPTTVEENPSSSESQTQSEESLGFEQIGNTLFVDGATERILVSVAKIDKKNQNLKATTWDVYEGESASVDLSKLNKRKESYLLVKADYQTDDEAQAVIVPASKTIKVKYNKKNGELEVTDTATKGNYSGPLLVRADGNVEGEVIQISNGAVAKPAEGNDFWRTVSLPTYQMSGAALYFSVPDGDGQSEGVAAGEDEYTYKADGKIAGTTISDAVVLYTFRSKEVKTVIGKLANAPKIKADYVKGTITVPKGVVYRVLSSSPKVLSGEEEEGATQAVNPTKFTSASDKTVLTVTQPTEGDDGKFTLGDKEIDASNEFAIEVQVPAVSNTKLASKIGCTVFKKQTATALTEGTGESITNIFSYDDFELAKDGTLSTTIKSTDTTSQFLVYFTKNNKEVSVKMKNAAAKLTKVAANKPIYIQRLGDKKEETWSGNKAELISKDDVVAKFSIKEDSSIKSDMKGDDGGYYLKDSEDKLDISKVKFAKDTVIELYITDSAATGYEFTINGEKTEVKGSEGNYYISVTMPEKDVTIAATKKEPAA